MLPALSDADTFWEHVFRYRFAATFVADSDVLDIASGEGYGTASLAASGARSVVGVDISAEACAHATAKYKLRFLCGDARAIPVASASIDTVISFETIEHVPEPQLLLDECARVLRPGGTLVISTPNKSVYSEHGHHNQFHCSELDITELRGHLARRFHRIELYTQVPHHASILLLRSLSAKRSQWSCLRGYWRLRSMTSSPSTWDGLRARFSECAEKLIITRLPMALAGWNPFNPFAIRRHTRLLSEAPLYYVAVCRGVRT